MKATMEEKRTKLINEGNQLIAERKANYERWNNYEISMSQWENNLDDIMRRIFNWKKRVRRYVLDVFYQDNTPDDIYFYESERNLKRRLNVNNHEREFIYILQ